MLATRVGNQGRTPAPVRGLLRNYLERPQQLWLRRALLQVHLWAGLLAALYIIAIGLSGSLLVFKDELMPRPHFTGARPDPDACTPDALLRALQHATAAYPQHEPVLASCPTPANPFFAIALHPPTAQTVKPHPGTPAPELTVYVHPATGQVAGTVDQDATWVGFVDRFHLDLLLQQNGRQWNGVGAAVLLLLVLSGLFLWWPGIRHWTRGFKLSLRANLKRLNWDLHHALGIWTVLFTLVWALTGIYFAWPSPFEAALARVSPVTTARYPAQQIEELAHRPDTPPGPPLDLHRVLQRAVEKSPGAHLAGLFFGSGPKPILTLYMARSAVGDYARTDFLYVDQRSGTLLLTWHRGQNHTAGDWALWLLAPLHFGTSWGIAGKVTWATLGLVLPVLTVTGLVMYWNRSLRKWWRTL